MRRWETFALAFCVSDAPPQGCADLASGRFRFDRFELDLADRRLSRGYDKGAKT